MTEIPLFLNEEYAKRGISKYISWNPAVAPHLCAFGTTGSGKTYGMKLCLAKVSKYEPNSQFYIADYKGDFDFTFLEGSDRFYRFMGCSKALDEVYQTLQKRQSGEDKNRNMILLYVDEWASYLLSLERKKAEEEKQKLSTLLMLSRSFNIHIFVSQQRVDSQYFGASRDCFNFVLALSNLSKEGKDMMFHDYKDLMKSDRKRGTGYILVNGTDFAPIIVPTISNMELVHRYIKDAVNR